MNLTNLLAMLKPGHNRSILLRIQEGLDNLRTIKRNLKESKEYYASLPLWNQDATLPLHQWIYFLSGSVGVYFMGSPVINGKSFSHAKLRTSKPVELPESRDEDREITIIVDKGYCYDHISGRNYVKGDAIHFARNEFMSLEICGEFRIIWVPAISLTETTK